MHPLLFATGLPRIAYKLPFLVLVCYAYRQFESWFTGRWFPEWWVRQDRSVLVSPCTRTSRSGRAGAEPICREPSVPRVPVSGTLGGPSPSGYVTQALLQPRG